MPHLHGAEGWSAVFFLSWRFLIILILFTEAFEVLHSKTSSQSAELIELKFHTGSSWHEGTKIVSEYDQEIPQSQTADNPVAPRGRAAQPSRDTRKTN